MSEFIQLHLMKSHAPSNLNRDESGRPKTASVGNVDRLRVSSQCTKRSCRTSDAFQEAMGDVIGTRTKNIGVEVFNQLLENGVEKSSAMEWAKMIGGKFGKLKPDNKSKKKGEESDDPLDTLRSQQIVHFSTKEIARVYNLVDVISNENREPTKEELGSLFGKDNSVDIAMFGRMSTSSTDHNVEAAVQVSHAFTVNSAMVESDYFTAVDELNHNNVGSAHIGDSFYGSGVYYYYVCINKTLLVENLGGDEDLANKSIRAFVEVMSQVTPSGKQNSFASRERAFYVLAEKGTQQPRQLSLAFLKPVDGCNMSVEAIDRLETLRSNMDKAYGKCCDDFRAMNVHSPEESDSFDSILEFVGQ